jgi:hypothetical protein
MRNSLHFSTRLLALLTLCFSLFPYSVKAQSKAAAQEQIRYPTYSPGGVDMRGVTVHRIRSLSPQNKAVQIELQNATGGFYVGALDWVLWVGDSKLRRSNCVGEGWASSKIICFTLSKKDWDNLRQDEPLILTWGDSEEQRDRTLPFSKLDKRLFDKKPKRKIGK